MEPNPAPSQENLTEAMELNVTERNLWHQTPLPEPNPGSVQAHPGYLLRHVTNNMHGCCKGSAEKLPAPPGDTAPDCKRAARQQLATNRQVLPPPPIKILTDIKTCLNHFSGLLPEKPAGAPTQIDFYRIVLGVW